MNISSLLLAGRFSTMTSYFSIAFLAVFLPVCVIGYTLMPERAKKYFLLVSSLAFFWLISGKLIIYMLLTILSMHYFGIWLDRIHRQRDDTLKTAEKSGKKAIKKVFLNKTRWVLLFASVLQIGMLLVLKYTPFFAHNINSLLDLFGLSVRLEIPHFIMPVGISFFTFQAVSYLFDVYREIIKADDNIFRLGLFISFFPQIVEGPICRYSQTAEQLWNVKGIEYKNLTFGLQRILYGLMKKIIIADRLNPIITNVFKSYGQYDGGVTALAAVCYTIQLYMDFSGTMDAIIGVAEIFGVKMPENFKRPFFSKTVSEFWTRWHVSLGAWFKDYIFYPVTMSKPMKNLTSSARKKLGNHFGPLIAGSIALFCVWFSNGLWHGAAWSFIFFGMYHFVIILTGNIIAPAAASVNKKLHINPNWSGYRLFQIIRTCILVVIGELFFRAEGLRAGFSMFRTMITDFTFENINESLLEKLGVDVLDFAVVGIALVIVFVFSILNEKGISVRESLAKRNIVLRWMLIYALIMFIVVFGAYGVEYTPVDPIYANF